jgi:hypothetical protein
VRAFGSDIMVTSSKKDRDRAARFLRQTLRRLGSLTTEEQLHSAMVTAEQQYMEVFRLHGLYCLEKGEDQGSGAHMEWEDSVGNANNDTYTVAEDKLEFLTQAKQPVEVTAKAKLERAGSLKTATLSIKDHEGILVEEYCIKQSNEEAKVTPEGEEFCDNGQVKTAKDNAQFEEETETNTEEVEDVYQEIPKRGGHFRPGGDNEIHGEVGDDLGGSFREESDRRGSLRGYLGGGQCGLHPEEGSGLCGGVWLYQDSDHSQEVVDQQAVGWGGLAAHSRPPDKSAELVQCDCIVFTQPVVGGSELRDDPPDVVGGVLVV